MIKDRRVRGTADAFSSAAAKSITPVSPQNGGLSSEFSNVVERELPALAVNFANRFSPVVGQLHLARIGTLILEKVGIDFTATWQDRIQASAAPELEPGSVSHAIKAAPASRSPFSRERQLRKVDANLVQLPVVYSDEIIGELRLRWQKPVTHSQQQHTHHLAKQCARLAKRYEAQKWAEQRLGRSLLLAGDSLPIQNMEAFIETASHSSLPVLISGEFGTEKAQLAAFIHASGPRRNGPFVEVNCLEPTDSPERWIERAKGGTLFLSGVDELSPALQSAVLRSLYSRLGQRLVGPIASNDLRVIASTTADLSALVRDGDFSRSLLAELDFLTAHIAPLRDRRSDIEALVSTILVRYGHDPEKKQTEALNGVCRAYGWPDNVYELERIVARLAVMTIDQPIHQADIHSHTPRIVNQPSISASGEMSLSEKTQLDNSNHDGEANSVSLKRSLLNGAWGKETPDPMHLHPGLQRALRHLNAHYAEQISLGKRAQHALVSPSHLTFLFRNELGNTFKSVLQAIRVQKASEILLIEPRQRITDVAMRVGFSDLSHFEKSFRRIAGKSPREFRHTQEPLPHRHYGAHETPE